MLKIGIIGLPNIGKSTLFKALTRQKVDISNYPFCTIHPNIGVIKVPNKRLKALSKAFPRPNIIPAAIEFVDIAGLVKGASLGQGLGNKFLAQIREVDVILQVVRMFENQEIAHSMNEINPVNDIKAINTELILADQETISNQIQKLEKQKQAPKKETLEMLSAVKKVEKTLEQKKFAKDSPLSKNEQKIIKRLFLLTSKPIFYLYNYSGALPSLPLELEKKEHLFLDVKLEEELRAMERKERKELGIKTQINKLIKKSFQLLNLITFFTINEKEIRAWETKQGTKAPQAGGKIHSDFEEKFIKIEVMQSEELIQIGSWSKAKEHGAVRNEGKNYLVQDGDVIYFLI